MPKYILYSNLCQWVVGELARSLALDGTHTVLDLNEVLLKCYNLFYNRADDNEVIRDLTKQQIYDFISAYSDHVDVNIVSMNIIFSWTKEHLALELE